MLCKAGHLGPGELETRGDGECRRELAQRALHTHEGDVVDRHDADEHTPGTECTAVCIGPPPAHAGAATSLRPLRLTLPLLLAPLPSLPLPAPLGGPADEEAGHHGEGGQRHQRVECPDLGPARHQAAPPPRGPRPRAASP
jgi:hypothetical protein